MSLFDSVIGAVKEMSGDTISQNPLFGQVLEMVNAGKSGGLAGLVQNFKDKGLGEAVASWVGTGSNLPISAAQIQQVLGNQQIQQLAAKVGISPDMVTSQLAQLLPEVIDNLTPGGTVPTHDVLEQGIGLLKNKLMGVT